MSAGYQQRMSVPAFQSLDNFRDFGGYPATDGRGVLSGRLFRSAHHADLTETDLASLGGLGLGTVVDLRRPVERERQPSRRPAAATCAVLDNALDRTGEASHITFLKTQDLTADSGRRFMARTYAEMPFAPAHLDLFARYFDTLARTDASVLIHCTAGKDRTGLLVALTHHLLGVHRDDTLADYLLTNTAVNLFERAPAIAGWIESMSGRRPSAEAVVAFLGVEPMFLESAFAAIDARHGDLDAYLEHALGVTPDKRAAIRARLVA